MTPQGTLSPMRDCGFEIKTTNRGVFLAVLDFYKGKTRLLELFNGSFEKDLFSRNLNN